MPPQIPDGASSRGKRFTRAEVAKHRSPNDAWIVIEGKVSCRAVHLPFFSRSPQLPLPRKTCLKNPTSPLSVSLHPHPAGTPLDALSRAPRALPLPTTGGQNVDVAFMTVHTLFILVVLPINLFD